MVSGGSYNTTSIQFLATSQIAAGNIKISFGGIRNPKSYTPTDVFILNSTDALGNKVGDGSIDNIRMTVPA